MNLQVGITELRPEWEIILDQIGLSYKVVEANSGLNPEDCAAIIISGSGSKLNPKSINEYLQNGGTLLCEADSAADFLNIKTIRTYIKYFYSKDDPEFPDLPVCDLYNFCETASGSTGMSTQKNEKIVMPFYKGAGKGFVFPTGFAAQILNTKIKRKNFYSPWSKKETTERVAKISKGAIKQYLQAALENLFHHRNLPFVNLWHFPDGVDNIFGFRVDTDFAGEEELTGLYEVCRKHHIPAVWFVETSSAGNKLEVFKKFERQEIALHCREHKVFKKYQEMQEDIDKGLKGLSPIAPNIQGYAAPFGQWDKTLGNVLNEQGFNYSSEFGFSCDSLPFFPFLDNKFSNTLQIPIHPVSPGRLFWSGHQDNEILDYYFRIIDKKLSLYEPIILYTHPGEKRFEIFDKIFDKINSLQIGLLTFNDYTNWWRRRNSTEFIPRLNSDKVVISTGNKDNSIWKRIVLPNKEVYLSPLSDNENIYSKKIASSKFTIDYEEKLPKLKSTTLRMLWHNYLFYRRNIL